MGLGRARTAASPAAMRRPASVRAAVVLVMIEAAALLAFTGWFFADLFPVPDPVATRLAMGLGAVVFQVLVVVALLFAARGLAGLHHWPRSLLLILQVFALIVGVPIARDGLIAGWVVCVLALATVVALLVPTTTAAIEGNGGAGE